MRRTWRTLAVISALAVLGSACGGSGSGDDADGPTTTTNAAAPDSTTTTASTAPTSTAPTSTTATSTTPTSTTSTSTTTTSTTASTTTAPPEDPPAIANPDRPWVIEARDELVERTGLGLGAANCVFELTESEGVDPRQLIWDDDWTPPVIQIAVGACGTAIDGPFELPSSDPPPDDHGDNIELDLYWDWCAAGDGVSCDVLWFSSPSDTAYEAFGETCGQRSDNASCPALLGTDSPGESPYLDRALQSCLDGYASSCEDLEFYTDSGEYHRLGQTCGDRIPAEADPDCAAAIAAES